MLEIYNEEYKDLLSKGLPAGKKHQVGCLCLSLAHATHLTSIGISPLTMSDAVQTYTTLVIM